MTRKSKFYVWDTINTKIPELERELRVLLDD